MTKLDRVNSVDSADIVIVGNGIAGLTAAVDARRLAPDKRIIMITEQSHPTINTPALKQFAIGKLDREQLLAYPAGTERAQLIHVCPPASRTLSAKFCNYRANAEGPYFEQLGSDPLMPACNFFLLVEMKNTLIAGRRIFKFSYSRGVGDVIL